MDIHPELNTKQKARNSKVLFLVILILVMTAALLYMVVQFRYQDFINSHQLLAEQSVDATSFEIQRYIENQRHLAELYAKVENQSLAELANSPDDVNNHKQLFRKLKPYIPEAHNYTIADILGNPLLPDTGKMVGKGCRKDILGYAKGNKINKVFVHSNPTPTGYHFDVLTDVDANGGFQGIFFISIDTSVLSAFLHNFQLPGHQIILTRPKSGKTLIELTSDGPRPMLNRETTLSNQELESTLYSTKIPGTHWTLNDIPVSTLFTDQLKDLILQAVTAWLIFFSVCILMLLRISTETRQRIQAEFQLMQARDKLQQTVEERTSELRESRDELYHQATHDSLTGLINRKTFDHSIENVLNNAYGDNYAVLAYLDLDQFKLVNDSCGHFAGDELLKQVVSIIKGCLRDSDEIGRLGGDEFGVLLLKCPLAKAIEIMEPIIKKLGESPFHWGNKSFVLNVSIGLTEINENSKDATELLRQADLACYVAKDLGRGRIHAYTGKDSESSKRNKELGWLSDIPSMIENNHLLLYAQSINDISTDEPLQRYEILLRLRGMDNQIIPPGDIIPAAERYNLMQSIDRWVIENTFAFIADLNKKPAGIQPHLSINLSANSINDESMIAFIREQQNIFSIMPSDITFEITETAAISDLANAKAFIAELMGYEYSFALDDFGTGVASFEYLKQLPVDVLKIDGSFIVNIANDPVNQALVQAMTQAAHALGKKTIAEFVEDEATLSTIKQIGVDYAQGYYFDKPADLNTITEDTTKDNQVAS